MFRNQKNKSILLFREHVLNIFNAIKTIQKEKKNFHLLGIPFNEVLRLKNLPFKYDGETCLFGRKIHFNSPFWYLFGLKEIFLEKQYLFKTKSLAPLIIDCGSNIGLSLIFFKRQYPNSRIIAFEADPEIFKILKKNVQEFSFEGIELNNKAIWVDESILNFEGNDTVGGKVDALSLENKIGINKIQGVRLKDLLSKKIDFLKIDIEGAESEVLNDCKDSLNNVQNIFIEYHSTNNDKPQELSALLNILEKNGFRYYIKEAWPIKMVPFNEKKVNSYFDLQLNIFGYRV